MHAQNFSEVYLKLNCALLIGSVVYSVIVTCLEMLMGVSTLVFVVQSIKMK